ncbi:MAG: AMP-binding protein [Gammaproteobacteria bacterium]
MMLHEIFEQACQEHPGAYAAMTTKNEKLTYATLLSESRQLAHYFAKQGISLNQSVAIAMPRSILHLKVTLALSMIGATSLFIDVLQPLHYLKAIFSDADPCMIVTTKKFFATLLNNGTDKIPALILDELEARQQIDIYPTASLIVNYGSQKEELIAYMCYTSGSTGKPKGVPIKHLGLAYWSALSKKHLNIQPQNIILGFASPAFDAYLGILNGMVWRSCYLLY